MAARRKTAHVTRAAGGVHLLQRLTTRAAGGVPLLQRLTTSVASVSPRSRRTDGDNPVHRASRGPPKPEAQGQFPAYHISTLNKVVPSLLTLTQTPSLQSVLVGAVADDTSEAQHYETWKANREAQKLATTMAPMIAAIVKKEINALVAPSSGGLNPYETEYYDRMAKVSGLGQ